MADDSSDSVVTDSTERTSESFDTLKDLPVSVDQIRVSPDELQTRLLLIQREIKQARKAGTFEEVLTKTMTAVDNLKDLGVFREVTARLDAGLPVRSLRNVF